MNLLFRLVNAFILFILLLKVSFSQNDTTFRSELKFVEHLINIDDKNAALQVLSNLSTGIYLTSGQQDSVNYYFGWIHYNNKQVDTSSFYFNKVSYQSPFYFKSAFYKAFNYAYSKQNNDAYSALSSINTDSNIEYCILKRFELSGVSLLKRDFAAFEKMSAEFKGDYYPVAENESLFVKYYQEIKNRRKKSALLAGTLSAVLPGSGKFYTGFKGEGATAMLTVLSLGVLAAESFYRAGPKSPQFIALTGFFSVFYFGNIWGSVTSVKKRDDAYYKELDRNILLDLHMPLRRVFN